MTPLARLWTRVGSYFVPLVVLWALYIRNGLDKATPDGVAISRAYWGLIATLIAGSVLAVTLALYMRVARRKRGEPWLPPNTAFEDKNERSPVISRATAVVFGLSIMFGLVIFGLRYSNSEIHAWDVSTPLQKGFVRSRIAAFQDAHCPKKPCFAIAKRVDDDGKPVDGVIEYVPYVNDVVLFGLAFIFLASLMLLLMRAFKSEKKV